MSVVYFDSGLSGLEKINLISLLHSFVQRKDVNFNEKSGVATNVRLPNKRTFEGNLNVLRYVGRISQHLYSTDPVESTVIDQFVDLAFGELLDRGKLANHVEELNVHLAMRTYFSGYQVTIADIAVFAALTNNTRWAAMLKEKEKYPHLIRWYKFLESFPNVKALLKNEKTPAAGNAESKEAAASNAVLGSMDIGISKNATNICTRFPPEPSGYMHIGHAKAAMLNDIISKQYNGKCLVRFDDTNPSKEKDEYVQSILEDIATLGIDYVKPITHTSDYFDVLMKYCVQMITEGNAYCDDTDVETMRSERMACVESRNRNNSVEKNLQLWEEMQKGTEIGLKNSVRAKIDMSSRNGTLRDPVIYRCNLLPHHRTGEKYKVYPTYDFACPIVDSIEGVSHALRTSEYNDRNDQYFWVLDALKLRKPAIEDYSRLNMVYTLLSKRKLTWFVNEGYVNGWDDPRFPTVRGMLRRGLEVEALRRFVVEQGFSKNTNLMEWDKIWNFNKKLIDPVVHRYTVVSKDEKVLFELEDKQNWEEFVDIDLHPKNKEVGTKSLLRSGKIWLELADAQEIAENEEVTLIGWGNAIIKSIEKDAQGQITKLRGKTHLEGSVKTTKKKLTWIAQTNNELKKPIQITLVDLDYLITVPSLEEGMSFESVLRPKSETWKETSALGEFEMRNVRKGQTIQVNRRGFYKCDRAYESDEKPAILFFIPDGRTKAASLLIKQ